MKRLAIVVTHPIQYYAPVFQLIARRAHIVLRVFYTWGSASVDRYDPGFQRSISWDLPLLEGYDYSFVHNTSTSPGSSHFRGIINPTLIQEVLDWRPDAVLVYGWSYHSHLDLIRRLKGQVPIWFRGDSHLLNVIPPWKAWVKLCWLRWLYSHIDLAFYVGTANKEYYLRYGLRESQLRFAPHAVDNLRFSDSGGKYTREAKLWKKELGIEENDIVLLFAGKFENIKQPLLLLNTVQHLNTTRSNKLKLILVGNGQQEQALKEQAQDNQHIIFLDFQNQSKMPIIYRLGNIFCLPSSSETWGLAINESLASGIPVLVSNKVGCASDLVVSGKTGEIFRAGDQQRLNMAIEQMVHDYQKGLYNSVEAYIEAWSFEQQVLAFEQALNS